MIAIVGAGNLIYANIYDNKSHIVVLAYLVRNAHT